MAVTVPDFHSYQERDRFIIDHADYFTVVRPVGSSFSGKLEVGTLAEARTLAERLCQVTGRPWLIYAVCGIYDAFVEVKR